MWVHKWNPVTCKLDLVNLGMSAVKALKPMSAALMISCVGGDILVPPVEAHTPPVPPIVVARVPPVSEKFPGYPPPWGSPYGGGFISTPPATPSWLPIPVESPRVVPPNDAADTAAGAYHTEHTPGEGVPFEEQCDITAVVDVTPPGQSSVPEPGALSLVLCGLAYLGIARMVWRY